MDKVKPSFVVDLSKTMIIDYSNLEQGEDRQKLFCNCGSSQEYSQKIVRNIVLNHDELTEDGESINSISCHSCKKEYNKENKLYLLSPDSEELYRVDYSLEDLDDKISIIRKKNFAKYSNKGIKYKQYVDSIILDKKTNKVTLNLTPPFESEYFSGKNNKNLINDVYGKSIDLTNVLVLEEFFFYKESIIYSGLNCCFEFIDFVKNLIKDFPKFKEDIPFVNHIFSENSKIEEVSNENFIYYYQMCDSGFGDGNLIRKKVVPGDYLFNTLNCYKLLLSVLSFESSSTIILTKGYLFFKKWIESNFITTPEIYNKENSTNPNKIIETSLKYNKSGDLRLEFGSCNNDISLFKISSTIYNSLRNMDDLNTLSKIYCNGFLKKNEMEELIQKYNNRKLYELLNNVLNKRVEDIQLEYRHIEHILKNDFKPTKDSENFFSHDFLSLYLDTIRVIDLLELKDKIIFKSKDFISLKEVHDDYTARFNAMKDLQKAKVYKSSVKDFLELNCRIGDVEFEVVESSEKLNLEGLQMKHCIYTYLNRICEKRYLAINVTHLITKERATAGFTRNGNTLKLEQLKGFYNSRATEEIIICTQEFCHKNNINIQSSYDLTPDKTRQRLMPNQMTEEELSAIREEAGGDSEELKKLIKKNNNKFRKTIKKFFN